MERIIFALALIFSTQTQARPEFVSRYFNRVPIEKAHVVSGAANDRFFNPESIKILVWNIKKTQEAAWKQEFTELSKDKELFLLQEAYPNELFNTTLASLGNFRWDMGISFTYKLYDNLPTGTMIGSSVDASEVLVTHSPDLEPVTETPKAMTYAKYPIDGSLNELLVINIHGINFTGHSAFVRHMLQAEEEIKKHSGPVFMAGDFNTRTLDRLEYMFDMMKRLGLKEINFRNGAARMKAKFTNNILDHGFVRGLVVKDAEVFYKSLGSDHRPMTIEVAVQQ